MEPSRRNRWQPVANGRAVKPAQIDRAGRDHDLLGVGKEPRPAEMAASPGDNEDTPSVTKAGKTEISNLSGTITLGTETTTSRESAGAQRGTAPPPNLHDGRGRRKGRTAIIDAKPPDVPA